ncbi:MAG TPA: transcriptional regulator [Bryobacteraceae bacterium]|nr:transcriptional regulator [Bryobacteraceae bacterium]
MIILGVLAPAGQCDCTFLMNETGLTKGNLSSHVVKLEQAEFLAVEKTFRGKIPLTLVNVTPAGRSAFVQYRKMMLAVLS